MVCESAGPDLAVNKIANGDVDIAALPTNAAAALYAKTNGKIQVLAVNTLGVLYMLENGDSIQSVADLKGKTIYSTGNSVAAVATSLPKCLCTVSSGAASFFHCLIVTSSHHRHSITVVFLLSASLSERSFAFARLSRPSNFCTASTPSSTRQLSSRGWLASIRVAACATSHPPPQLPPSTSSIVPSTAGWRVSLVRCRPIAVSSSFSFSIARRLAPSHST